MNFDEYQHEAQKTAIYPKEAKGIYPALGLAEEAGEVVGKIGKVLRDDSGEISPGKLNEIKKELGDVLWMVSALSSDLGINLNEIAVENIAKLKSRKDRGVLGGSGDNR